MDDSWEIIGSGSQELSRFNPLKPFLDFFTTGMIGLEPAYASEFYRLPSDVEQTGKIATADEAIDLYFTDDLSDADKRDHSVVRRNYVQTYGSAQKTVAYGKNKDISEISACKCRVNPFIQANYSEYQCVKLEDLLNINQYPVKFEMQDCFDTSIAGIGTAIKSGNIYAGQHKVFAKDKSTTLPYVIGQLAQRISISYDDAAVVGDHYASTSSKYVKLSPHMYLDLCDINGNNLLESSHFLELESKDLITDATESGRSQYPAIQGGIYPYVIINNKAHYNSHHRGYGFVTLPTRAQLNDRVTADALSRLAYFKIIIRFKGTLLKYCPDFSKSFKIKVKFKNGAAGHFTYNSNMIPGYQLVKQKYVSKGLQWTTYDWIFVGPANVDVPTTFNNPAVKFDNTVPDIHTAWQIDLRTKQVENDSTSLTGNDLDTITTLEINGCFRNQKLEQIILPTKLTTIPASCFQGATLRYLQQQDSSGSIVNYLTEVTSSMPASINSNITTIGDAAFQKCTFYFPTIQLPKIVTIGQSAFQGSNLTQIFVGSDLTTLGKAAFKDCTRLTRFDDYSQTTAGTTFGDPYLLRFPKNISEIPSFCFTHSCTYDYALWGWRKYHYEGKTFTLDEGTTEEFVKIYLPGNIASIGTEAFHFSISNSNGPKLELVRSSNNLYHHVVSALNNKTSRLHEVHYDGSQSAYHKINFGAQWMDPFWKIYFALDQEIQTVTVEKQTYNLARLKRTYYTDQLADGYSYNTTVYERVNLLKAETVYLDIPDYAYQSCFNITGIVIKGSNVSIGTKAFSECYAIKTMTKSGSGSIYRIGDGAFNQCRSMSATSGFFADNFGVRYVGKGSLHLYGGILPSQDVVLHLETVKMISLDAIYLLGNDRDGDNISINFNDLHIVDRVTWGAYNPITKVYSYTRDSGNRGPNHSRIFLNVPYSTNNQINLFSYLGRTWYSDTKDSYVSSTELTSTYPIYLAETSTHVHVPKYSKDKYADNQLSYMIKQGILDDL